MVKGFPDASSTSWTSPVSGVWTWSSAEACERPRLRSRRWHVLKVRFSLRQSCGSPGTHDLHAAHHTRSVKVFSGSEAFAAVSGRQGVLVIPCGLATVHQLQTKYLPTHCLESEPIQGCHTLHELALLESSSHTGSVLAQFM
jgi:hypothetical protein